MKKAKSQPQQKSSAPWYSEGIRFSCTGSGKCCVSHGQYGFVYVTKADRKKMAEHLNLTPSAFTRTYCRKVDGLFALKDSENSTDRVRPCVFLNEKACGIYESRPTQCRTWPFWPETMVNQKTWRKDVEKFCPGVGTGQLWSQEKIQSELAAQKEWENQVARGK